MHYVVFNHDAVVHLILWSTRVVVMVTTGKLMGGGIVRSITGRHSMTYIAGKKYKTEFFMLQLVIS